MSTFQTLFEGLIWAPSSHNRGHVAALAVLKLSKRMNLKGNGPSLDPAVVSAQLGSLLASP